MLSPDHRSLALAFLRDPALAYLRPAVPEAKQALLARSRGRVLLATTQSFYENTCAKAEYLSALQAYWRIDELPSRQR